LSTQQAPQYILFMASQTELDRIDRRILALLAQNARITNQDLAAQVGLSPSSCLERVRGLRERGVIRGVHADLAPEALGVGMQALVAVRLRQHTRELVDGFQRYAAGLPEVLQLYHVTGEEDFLVHVGCRDAHQLREFTLDAFTGRPEVAQIHTSLIFEHVRKFGLPDYLDGQTDRRSEAQ
jgi:DNA-binding Lrp family transcriptional regulator